MTFSNGVYDMTHKCIVKIVPQAQREFFFPISGIIPEYGIFWNLTTVTFKMWGLMKLYIENMPS